MPSLLCPTRLSLLQNALDDTHSGNEPISIIARTLPESLEGAINVMIEEGAQLLLAKGTPESLHSLLSPYIPRNAQPLLEDALKLVHIYQKASGLNAVRFRLEQINRDSCRKFHTDHVALRLLCTYYGRGTQWLPTAARQTDLSQLAHNTPTEVHHIPTGHIALLQGNRWPRTNGQGVVHRSPPVSHLPMPERLRLLLTVDEPTACGMGDEHNPTIRP